MYDGAELTACSGVEAVRNEIRNARLVFDERTAAISYGILHTQLGTFAWIEKHYRAYLREWRVLGPLRGALIDMKNFQASRTPVIDMLDKGVSVSYPIGEPYRAVFTQDEIRGLRRVATKAQFCRWVALTSFQPHLDLSRPNLWPSYRRPLEERLTDPVETPPVSRLQQMEELSAHLKMALGDLLFPSSIIPSVYAGAHTILAVGDARLLVEPITELRMMAWAITHRLSSMTDLLNVALIRGWAFSLVYPPNYLETVKVIRNRLVIDREVKEYRDLPDLEDEFDIQEEWVKQCAVARDLVRLPHSRAFLFKGGVVRRLALLYGDEQLEEWRLEGVIPSISVTSHGKGREDTHGFKGDQVSELESQLLVGTLRHRESGLLALWFPTTEMLVRHGYCNGEWNSLAENVIRTRFDSLQRGEKTYYPLMELQWEDELAKSSPNKLWRNSIVNPDNDEIDELLQAARKEMRSAWNSNTLEDIEQNIGQSEDAWWRN